MVTIKRIKQLANLAGFKYSHEDDVNPKPEYVCFDHPGTNAFRILLSTKLDEDELLCKLFYQCKRVGRIQVRQELAKIADVYNYD